MRKRQDSDQRLVTEESEPAGLTLADIDADTGKGPAASSSGGKFYATTEEFIASLWADRNGPTG